MPSRSAPPVRCLLVAFGLLVAAGCATPIAPSGGPEDTTPPLLETSEPAADAVNVRAERLVLTFSENVDEASAARAFGIAPGWETPPDVRVHGRRVEVTFPDSLRANTTYVVTFDTNLRDLRNVALPRPITLAFATGPVLDRGQHRRPRVRPADRAPRRRARRVRLRPRRHDGGRLDRAPRPAHHSPGLSDADGAATARLRSTTSAPSRSSSSPWPT